MRLKLDAEALDGQLSPGSIATYEAGEGDVPDRRLLNNAELRPLPPIAHDPISRLEFGDGRERNAIFAVSPADPAAESILAVVSLKADDTVEVRLLRPGAPDTPDGARPEEGRRPIFGIFALSRAPGECGF